CRGLRPTILDRIVTRAPARHSRRTRTSGRRRHERSGAFAAGIPREPIRDRRRRRASGKLIAAAPSGPPPARPPPRTPRRHGGRLVVRAAGKAAGSMTEVAEGHSLDAHRLPRRRIGGIAVTRHGYGRPTRLVPVIEAGHPVPDAAGLSATGQALDLADRAGQDGLVLVVLAGGGSGHLIAPRPGVAVAGEE